jgi:hypothetical protein
MLFYRVLAVFVAFLSFLFQQTFTLQNGFARAGCLFLNFEFSKFSTQKIILEK